MNKASIYYKLEKHLVVAELKLSMVLKAVVLNIYKEY